MWEELNSTRENRKVKAAKSQTENRRAAKE